MKNPHAVALGRRGGRVGAARGGQARARALSPERRSAIARTAAAARWGQLPQSLRNLFWSYRFEDLRLPEDVDLIMLHVLTYGSSTQKSWLRRRFGDPGIRRWIEGKRGGGLTLEQMSPWVSTRTARRWLSDNAYAQIWQER